MKNSRLKFLTGFFIASAGLTVGLLLLHAQVATTSLQVVTASPPAAQDSIVQLTADAQGLDLIPPGALPKSGTFWLITPGGFSAPYPCPPPGLLPTYSLGGGAEFVVDGTGEKVALKNPRRFGRSAATPTVGSALEAQANQVIALIDMIQGAQLSQMMQSMGMGAPSFTNISSGNDTNNFYSDSFNYHLPTNGLWLDITNVSGGMAFVNLHNATNAGGVYEIFTKTNLLQASWDIAGEMFPTDTNCNPFTVAASPGGDPASQFLWARDWTGVTSLGNTVPEWWFWKYFGTVNLSDATLDTQGNTLLDDYTSHQAPANVIQFTIEMPNAYVNSSSPALPLNITAGIPFYYAVLVNGSTATNWQAYTSSNLVATLGTTDGTYNVSIGLRGFPANGTQTWQGTTLIKDTVPMTLVLTNLGAYSGSRPFIDPAGYSTKSMSRLTFCVTNAAGGVSQDSGVVVDQDCNPADMNHVTNRFKCLDVALTLGTNRIGIQAVDWAGNVTTTNFSYIFDTTGDTTPPAVAMTWPQDGMEISGNSITLRGMLDDDTATVTAQTTDTNNNVQTYNGLVERDGRFWLQNLPLNPGTNVFTMTATDAAGNSASTNLTLVQSGVTLTMDTVDASQLNQVQVNVTGAISPGYAVWVNGMQGTNNGDGTWLANKVPVTVGGVASFDITAYPPGYAPTGNSWTNFASEEEAYPNPLPADPVQSHADWDKPAVVYRKNATWHATRHSDLFSATLSGGWSQGGGGYYQYGWTNNTGASDVISANWPPDGGDAPSLLGEAVEYRNGALYSVSQKTVKWYWGDFVYIAGSGVYSNYYDGSYLHPLTWAETRQDILELSAGGMALRQAKRLFILSGDFYWFLADNLGEGDWGGKYRRR